MDSSRVSMQIEFNVQIWKEGGQFVAHALPLDVASSGPTAELARQALGEAVDLFLRAIADQGTIVQVLEEAGYVQDGSNWRSPSWISIERHTAEVAA